MLSARIALAGGSFFCCSKRCTITKSDAIVGRLSTPPVG